MREDFTIENVRKKLFDAYKNYDDALADKFKNGGRGRRVNKGERQSDFGVAGGYMLPRHYGWLFYRNPFFGKTLCVVYDRTLPRHRRNYLLAQ